VLVHLRTITFHVTMNHDTPTAATQTATTPLGIRLPWEFAFSAGWLLVGLLVFSAVTVAWRRWVVGALVDPPTWMPLLAAGFLAAAAAASARRLQAGHSSNRLQPIATWIPTVALGLFGLAMTFPGSSVAAIGGFWAILVAEEAWAFSMHSRAASKESWIPNSPGSLMEETGGEVSLPARSAADHVVQHIERTEGKDGVEGISGWLMIPVAVGQRTVYAHVAFCPPFGRVPTWNPRQAEGPHARLRTTQLMAYGARIELKLDASPVEPAEILVKFDGQVEAK
jgi:hypothetical protein